MMNINQIYEDCFLLIMRRFAIQELIRYRRVCHWWKEVIERMFLAKRSVKIFGSKDDVFYYCHELPKYNLHRVEDFVLRPCGQRDDDIVCRNGLVYEAITYLFPNLKSLLICNYQNAWQLELPSTLKWFPQLESLTLFGLYQSTLPPNFWYAIKRLRCLKDLNFLDMGSCKIICDLPVLENLQQLTLIDYDFYVGAFLQELGSNIRVLRLDNVDMTVKYFKLCLEANPLLTNNLTHLTIGTLLNVNRDKVDYRQLFNVIGTLLKKLVSLDVLVYREIRLIDAITELCQLPNLNELALNIGWTDSATHLDDALMSPRFESVKRLYITDFTQLTTDKFCSIFPRIFPNLEFLQLNSLDNVFLASVESVKVNRFFPRLTRFQTVYPKMYQLGQQQNVDYEYAGRHQDKFFHYMAEQYPALEQPENVRDEILDALYYSEGEGDDAEMFRAVFDD